MEETKYCNNCGNPTNDGDLQYFDGHEDEQFCPDCYDNPTIKAEMAV